MKFKCRMEFDVQIGRLFFRTYNTVGPGLCFRRTKSSQMLGILWLGWLMFELSWLHCDECECYECMPF